MIAILECVAIRIPYLRLVPIWDSRQYWDGCVGPALQGKFDPLAFNCFGHRTMLYAFSVAWPQYFDYGSEVLLNLAFLAIALLTIAAFYMIAARLFEPTERAASGIPAAALTLIFASMPVWTAPSLTLNPDSGVLLGFLVTLAFLLHGRCNLAAFSGIYLVLSKEMGLLLFVLLVVTEMLAASITAGAHRRYRSLIASRWTYLLAPIAYFATGMALRAASRPAAWDALPAYSQENVLIQIFLTFNLGARPYGAYTADLFVLNFAWILTLVIAVWLCTIIVSILRRRTTGHSFIQQPGRTLLVIFLTPMVLYAVTRFPTFNNVRYLLPAVPLIVLAFGAAVVSLSARPWMQIALFATVAVTQALSMWQTVDPLSRALFGTFAFGTNPILEMVSPTGECCGHGRDQLVYNLQFTHFATIQDAVFRRVPPNETTTFAISGVADWHLQGQIQRGTLRRTLRTTNVIDPPLFTLPQLVHGTALPAHLYFVAYPNVDNDYDLKLYFLYYDVAKPLVVDDGNGYIVQVYEMKRNLRPAPRFATRQRRQGQ